MKTQAILNRFQVLRLTRYVQFLDVDATHTVHGGFLWLLSGIVEKRQTINLQNLI